MLELSVGKIIETNDGTVFQVVQMPNGEIQLMDKRTSKIEVFVDCIPLYISAYHLGFKRYWN